MKFRQAEIDDVSEIMKIIKDAQESLRRAGIDQWQNNYPNPEILREDILKGNSYILIKDNNIVTTVVIIFGEEKTYRKIYQGQWLSELEYAVVHRIAVAKDHKGQGFASIIFKELEKICYERNIKSIRIDTHHDNKAMQRLLKKNGFKYCGIIYLEDESKRWAYEKVLK